MDTKIYDLRFNSDYSAFTCAMECGFRIYNTDPVAQMKRFDAEQVGSIRLCGLADRSNGAWFVSGGSRPKFEENVVALFDLQDEVIFTKLHLNYKVTAVCLKQFRIVVSSEKEIEVISYPELKSLKVIEMKDNSMGLLQITPFPYCDREIIVYPGCQVGSLQIMDITNIEAAESSTPTTLECHQNALVSIALNNDGSKLATASVKGTLIRIWDTFMKILLLELRRGCEPATVYSLSFNKTSEYLCCSSDKGTGHIFAIGNTKLNKQSLLNIFFGKHGGGNKSFATFTFPPECACVCAFVKEKSVCAIGMDGSHSKHLFNIEGSCDRDTYDKFVTLDGNIDMHNYFR